MPTLPTLPKRDAATRYQPHNVRRILCVFPRYSRSFGTFHHAFPLLRGVRAFMPPQGLLTIAAWLPESWEVRFVDENVRPLTDADYQWADAVFVSGMHIQRPHIERINGEAHRHGKITVLGGPSVSGCPEYYPEFDVLHLGELGDATEQVIEYLDGHTRRQLRFTTREARIKKKALPQRTQRNTKEESGSLGSTICGPSCPLWLAPGFGFPIRRDHVAMTAIPAILRSLIWILCQSWHSWQSLLVTSGPLCTLYL